MIDEGDLPAAMVCAACSQPLSRRIPLNEFGEQVGDVVYTHVRHHEADHEAVPQPRAEHFEEDLTQFCDFCTSTKVRWRYRAPGIQMIVIGEDDAPVGRHHSSSDWAACELCARLIERRSKKALLQRALLAWDDEEAREVIRESVRGLHEAFFTTLQPGRHRVPRGRR
ncbi:hypothetical protein [Glycomyces tenuis]|uniref:hypothetical protein n=1 Tax=Glycomyces tenuis TaxID=58116 RepID=UPI00040A2C3D|nr:hypothetical protein [Glycomyces tenuis]